MEARLVWILIEALTVAFCLVATMWGRSEFNAWVDRRSDRDCRGVYERYRAWRFRHAWMIAAGNLFPFAALIGPMREELVFRALLIAVFDRVDPTATVAIALSSLWFGLGHYKDVLGEEVISKTMERHKRQRMFEARFVFATGFGIALAVIGIMSESLWYPVIIHVGWNGALFLLSYVTLLSLKLRGRHREHRAMAIGLRRAAANRALVFD